MAVVMLLAVYILAGMLAAEGKSKSGQTTEKGKSQVEEKCEKTQKKVAIDAGHGGVDGGAVSVLGYSEKDINLSIALLLKEKLEEKNICVVMTRESDTGLYSETDMNKKIADMKARCEMVNSSCADVLISIHQNNYPSEGVKGAQVFYYAESAQGKKLGETLQRCLIEDVDNENGRCAKANKEYYLLLHINCPAVIAECGFLSNYEEAKLLETEEYQQKIADALCEGICVYLDEADENTENMHLK